LLTCPLKIPAELLSWILRSLMAEFVQETMTYWLFGVNKEKQIGTPESSNDLKQIPECESQIRQ
jgi:hypothetical protein